MAIGERIHFFRTRNNLTQKALGQMVGFDEKSADVRIAQYESGTRSPKENLISLLSQTFGISSEALTVPNIDSYTGLMHTLFALEDLYGLKIGEIDGELCLRLDKSSKSYLQLLSLFESWNEQSSSLKSGEISKAEYDHWRYTYPAGDRSNFHEVTPSGN